MKLSMTIIAALGLSACAHATPKTEKHEGANSPRHFEHAALSSPVKIKYQAINNAQAGVPYTVNFDVIPLANLDDLIVTSTSKQRIDGDIDQLLGNVDAQQVIPMTIVVTPKEGRTVVSVEFNTVRHGVALKGYSHILLNTADAAQQKPTSNIKVDESGRKRRVQNAGSWK